MIGHPREELLLAFQDHRLDDRRRRRMAGHLSGCQRCRNVVQAHRTVRGVFALEAPFAPDGVLERALASRATGTIVLLPVAEPDPIRRLPLPSRGFLIAAGVLVMFGVGIQVLPVGRFTQVFGALGAVIEDFSSFDGGSARILKYPDPPVARAAAVDPSRIRAVRAHYRTRVFQGNDPPIEGTLEVEITAEPGGWKIRQDDGRYELEVMTDQALHAGEWRWTIGIGRGRQHIRQMRVVLRGDSIFTISTRFVTNPGFTRPPTMIEYDSTFGLPNPPNRPFTIGEAHFFALLQGLPVRRGWVGSIADLYIVTDVQGFRGRPKTFVAVNGGVIVTPAGQFDTWDIRELRVGPGEGRFLVRKSDGLLVKHSGEGRWWGYETVLESVTYP